MKWPWQRQQAEGYTAQRLAEHTDLATVGTAGQEALPIVQACLSIWERGIAGIQIMPNNSMRLAELPMYLPMIGRSLALKGEAVFLIEPMGSSVRLRPASSVSVIGPDDPEKWLYLITLAAPSGTSTFRVLGERVLHFRVGATVQEPWRGRSPLTEKSVVLPARVEAALKAESALPVGIVAPYSGVPDQIKEWAGAVKKGGVIAIGASAGIAAPGGQEPASRHRPVHYRPEYDQPGVDLRDQLQNSILSAYGVPPALLDDRPSGNTSREAARRFFQGTVGPIALAMQQEIMLKAEPRAELSVPAIVTVDEDARSRAIARRAEAAMKLKELGLSNEAAMAAAGIEV